MTPTLLLTFSTTEFSIGDLFTDKVGINFIFFNICRGCKTPRSGPSAHELAVLALPGCSSH